MYMNTNQLYYGQQKRKIMVSDIKVSTYEMAEMNISSTKKSRLNSFPTFHSFLFSSCLKLKI